eukprot:Gb_18854 [translate_table: standard]
MGSFGFLISTSISVASVSICNAGYNGKEKSLDFHTGERFVEISAMNGKDWRLKRWTQMHIVCSLRASQARGPLWRGRVLSNESMQTVQAMKRAKGDEDKIEKVFQAKVSRLVKADLLSVLAELQRQDECDLALRVFKVVRQEMWYKPDLSLYAQMIMFLKRNSLVEEVELLFAELKKERLQPDTKAFTKLQDTFLRSGMPQNAVETYELMKQSGCNMDEYGFTVLIKGLERLGEPDLAEAVRKEFVQFLDGSMEFLKDSAQEIATS